jgi:2-(1,2-epoxy-1,2-dihydrophenyl)acetyl-CoA isomerase
VNGAGARLFLPENPMHARLLLTEWSVYATTKSRPPKNSLAWEGKPNMSNPETVLSSLTGGVLALTLNRPDKLNSFNEEMHLALRAGIQRAHDDDAVRAVLLTGAGRGFCAGQDLGDRDPRKGGPAPDLGHTIGTFYNPTLRLMRRWKSRSSAQSMASPLALAQISPSPATSFWPRNRRKFIQAFAKIGLVPDAGGTWSLARILGEPRAKALAMTAEPLPAEKAAEWGLIWKAVDDAALMVRRAGACLRRWPQGRRLVLA